MTQGHRSWLPALVVAGLAVASMLSGLGNGFAYDDVALLVTDSRLHSLGTLPDRLADSWWPTGLYRPVSLAWLACQWLLGSGSPIVFRIVSTVLYAGVCVAVFHLARQAGAGPTASLAGAAIFAVHPVHTEVTANVVGQAELLATLTAVIAVGWYVRARRGPALSRAAALGITGLFLVSAHAKEVGYVIPGLLILGEVFIVRDPRPWRARLSALREHALLLATAVAVALFLRDRVLGGLTGETPHPVWTGLDGAERGLTMLAVVPEWGRLLLWPARLQAEYGPPALMVTVTPGLAHAVGLTLVVALTVAVAKCWRVAPLVAFGAAWLAVGLAPVSNLVFPTGIILAERTLFLPSVGLALMVAGGADWLSPRLTTRPAVRRLVLMGFVVTLTVGGVRSAIRQPSWRDSMSILEETARDVPRSYSAQLIYGRELRVQGMLDSAEVVFRRATTLWDRDPRPFEELGQLLRVRGDCRLAIPVLEAGVRSDSTADVARSRLVECLIVERRWEQADREIHRGMAQGVRGYQHALGRVEAGRRAAPRD